MKPLPLAAALAAALLAAPAARADGLSLQAIDEVVEQNDRAIQSCARGLGVRRGQEVAVQISLTIDAGGHVAQAAAEHHSRSAACLENVVRRLQFPAPGHKVQLSLPFLLIGGR
jgi:hypothetical protein